MFHYSQIELVESGVATCGVLGGSDDDPEDVTVAAMASVKLSIEWLSCSTLISRSIRSLRGSSSSSSFAVLILT